MPAGGGRVPAGTPSRRRRAAVDLRTVVDGLVRLGDIAMVGCAGLVASALRFNDITQPDVATAALLIGMLLAGYAFALARVYDVACFTRLSHQLPKLLLGWCLTIAGVLVLLYGMKSAVALSRLWVAYWFLGGAVALVAWRLIAKRVILGAQANGALRRHVVLVGDGALMADCLRRLGYDDRGLAVTAVLVLDDATPRLPHDCVRIPDLERLEPALRELEADQVVLTVPLGRAGEIISLVRRLKHLPLQVTLYPDAVGAGLPLFGLTRLGDAPLVLLMQRPLDGWRYVVKAIEDRALAGLLLLILSPVLLGIAAAIRLTSPGPAVYRQLRHGFNGEPIEVFKFRSMHADQCDAPDAPEVRQATPDDPRVTSVGRVLRRTSLDELPQLLNVLRGDMSLVGPRPHAVAHDDYYSQLLDDYLGRQRVKPGITGWAQINGFRGETRTLEQMRRRIELDLEYIDNWSLWFDLRILIRTAILGFGDHAAY